MPTYRQNLAVFARCLRGCLLVSDDRITQPGHCPMQQNLSVGNRNWLATAIDAQGVDQVADGATQLLELKVKVKLVCVHDHTDTMLVRLTRPLPSAANATACSAGSMFWLSLWTGPLLKSPICNCVSQPPGVGNDWNTT